MNAEAPAEPTGKQCSQKAKVYESDNQVGYACWYPQMGGYVGKAVIMFFKPTKPGDEPGCFDAYVWHDGDFPFHDGQYPVRLHHCGAEQFIEFGRDVLRLMGGKESPAEAEGDQG